MIKVDKTIINIFKNSSRYMIVSILGAVINIVMMKYYTNIFSKVEYGIMSFYLSFFYFLLPFISLGIDSSFERIYYDYKDEFEKRNIFLNSMFFIIILINISLIALGTIVAPFFNKYLNGSIILYYSVLFAAMVCSWENFFSKMNIIEKKSNVFLKSKILFYIVGNSISVIFISLVFESIEARFIGLSIGYIVSLSFSLYHYNVNDMIKIKLKYVDKGVINEVAKYSLPILVTVILTTSFTYVDKIFIRAYSDFSSMADYSVGQNIGKVMTLFIESFTMAITPVIISGLKSDYDNMLKRIKLCNIIYIFGLISIGIIAIVFRKPIVSLLSSAEYSNSTNVFAYIILAYIIAGAYKLPSIVLMYHKKVNILPLLGMINLISNVVFNRIFVIKFGIVGVAFASYLSMVIYSMFNYIFACKYIYNIKHIILIFTLIFSISITLFLYFA